MCDRIPREQISPAAKVFVRCCWQGRNGSVAKHAADELLADSPADPSVRNADGMDAEWQRLADAILTVADEYEQHAAQLAEQDQADWCRSRAAELRTCLANVKEGTSRA